MRQLFSPAVLVLALVVLAQNPAAAQVVSVEPMSYDFGDMKQMQTQIAALTVTNNGAGLLQIAKVEADCGCTVPTLDKTSLAPGESTEIKIEFSSKRFNGKVHKAVHIYTNDQLNPVTDVILTATVFAPLLIDPGNQRLGFKPILIGETSTIRAIFTANGDKPLEISIGKSRKGLFEVKAINNLDGNPMMAALEVTIPSTIGPGHHRDNVRVITNVADFSTADIEIKASIKQELTASPEQLTFRFRKSFKQSIRIAPFRKGLQYKVTRVECDLPELEFEVIETIVNLETKILVKGVPVGKDDPRALASKGRLSGTIKVYTDEQDTPSLEIPVTYMVRM